MKTSISMVLLVALASCSSGESSWPPPEGNALISVSDSYERSGTVTVSISAHDADHIGLSVQGFPLGGVSYTVDEWERLLAGESLPLGFVPPSNNRRSAAASYEIRPGIQIGRSALSERLIHEGEEFTWTLEYGEATDSFGTVLTEEDATMTVTAVFSPRVRCSGCVPFVPGPGGCIDQADPEFEHDYCRTAIERFNLVEHGFVDAER